MAVYMIDYENVKTGGLSGISRLTDADRVIIFYSENANRLTFDLHQRLMASSAKIEYREVSVGGHNALDFQLVTYLGFLIAQDPAGRYLIISNDRGFEYVVNFWRRDGLKIGLLPYLKDPNYALQKATCPEGKPVAAAVGAPAEEPAEEEIVAEEEPAAEQPKPAEETAPEQEILTAAEQSEPPVEEAAPAEEAAPIAEPVPAEEPAPEVIFADAAAEEAAPAESAEVPAETPKPAKKKQNAPKKQEKKEDKKAEKPSQPKDGKKKKEDKADEPDEVVAPAETLSAETRAELRTLLGDSVADDPELRFVLSCVEKYKTKLGLNNALVKRFGNQKAGEIYQKLKPMLSTKKSTSPAPKQKNAPTPKPKKEPAGVS